MSSQLNDITVVVNNQVIGYTANSLEWQDGLGESSSRNAIIGGGQTEKIFSQALESKVGRVKFSMPTTAENEKNKRAWKLNRDQNVVQLIGPSGSGLSKIFTLAQINNDPTSSAATDGNIEIEFTSNPAQ